MQPAQHGHATLPRSGFPSPARLLCFLTFQRLPKSRPAPADGFSGGHPAAHRRTALPSRVRGERCRDAEPRGAAANFVRIRGARKKLDRNSARSRIGFGGTHRQPGSQRGFKREKGGGGGREKEKSCPCWTSLACQMQAGLPNARQAALLWCLGCTV